ncbi:Protein-glutamate methylesterase/protein-glutamine glutaminase [Streptomyces griseus]
MCETAIVREEGKITVFLLDDHEVVRRGVHELLASEPDIEVVGEAGTAADALVRIPATRPDVAVLDVRLPDGSGVEVCREVRSQDENIKCLMLTSYADDEALFDAIMAGASGYVLKAIRGNELLNAGELDLAKVRAYARAYRRAAGAGAAELAAAVHRVWWERLNDFWILRWRYRLDDRRADPQFPAVSALAVWWTREYEAVCAAFTE